MALSPHHCTIIIVIIIIIPLLGLQSLERGIGHFVDSRVRVLYEERREGVVASEQSRTQHNKTEQHYIVEFFVHHLKWQHL
jgi:hypothetical protein